MLHLDDRIGSIKVGKDADLVLWDNNPLSIYAKVEFTMIEGTVYYSVKENEQLQKLNTLEKARLLAKMLGENEKGAATGPYERKKEKHFHCDTIGLEGTTGVNQH
jgi:cytosine/adenosine deaminase-related metal-dependent hydrolase